MLDYAENRAQYGNMERRLYIKGEIDQPLNSIAVMRSATLSITHTAQSKNGRTANQGCNSPGGP